MHVVLGITNKHCLACHYWMYESAIVCTGIACISVCLSLILFSDGFVSTSQRRRGVNSSSC